MTGTIAEPPEAQALVAAPASSARPALAVLSLCVLLASLGTSIANVALPTLAEALGATLQEVQWIVLSYLLAFTTLIVSAGRLGDELGRRRLLLAGILLFTSASILCGLAPGLRALLGARAVQGLGAAIMMALAMAYVGDLVPKAKSGGVMGLLGTMSAVGTALAPSLGGALIAWFGWRALFLGMVPLAILTLLLAHRSLPEDRSGSVEKGGGFDPAGTLLLVLTLAAYSLAVTIGRGRFGPANAALLAAAGLGAVLFVLTERRAVAPLVQLSMLREPAIGSGLAASALVSTVMMSTLVVGPFYLSRALGLEPAMVGLVMSAGPLVAALTAAPVGRMVDRIGAARVTVSGLLSVGAGCSLLAALPVSLGITGYLAPIVVTTAGYAMFQTANNTAVMTGVRADRRGVASGVLNLSRNLGLITGASVMGALFALASGAADITTAHPAAVSAGMRATFAVGAVLILLALGLVAGGRPLPWDIRALLR